MEKNETYSFFAERLLSWYEVNKRALPWRENPQPYEVWLSEIIMQQTRVAQGLPYYERMLNAFPTVFDLANANEETVLKLWQGLGYYSRAKNLHATAKIVAYDYNGSFPDTYSELLKLKGVGSYTASAIASICFGQPSAVVDGNVYRVLARVFGIETPIDSREGKTIFENLAQKLLDRRHPGEYNQAVMEFGALQCKPQSPNCSQCVISDKCSALAQNKIGLLPIKIGKTTVRKRYFNYIVFINPNEKTEMRKRTEKDIWQGLYEFPLWESARTATRQGIEKWLDKQNISWEDIQNYYDKPLIHKLSHQHLHCQFWIVHTADSSVGNINVDEVSNMPVPILIANFWKEFGR